VTVEVDVGKTVKVVRAVAWRISDTGPGARGSGAVVSLMDRTNVETVIVAGKVRKWKGRLLDVDLRALRNQLEDSRDYIFRAANIPQNLFR
jgi:hypothetical protein